MTCKTCGTNISRIWYKKGNLCNKCYSKNYYHNPKNTERIKNLSTIIFRNKRNYLKRIIIWHYSGGTMKCECCGESIFEFLTVDHINNNGAEHRREIGRTNFYKWLIDNKLPSGFKIRCYNCNCGRRLGICPHKR